MTATSIGAPLRKWTTLCLLLCSIPTCALAQATNETTAAASSSATTSPHPRSSPYVESTCPFGTINYITHTLPQQCLRTGWSAPSPSAVVSKPGEPRTTDIEDVVHAIPWAPESEARASSPSQAGETASPEATTADASTVAQTEAEIEADSPLDNANFLSFEEWKKRNLERAGQSPDSVGQGRAASAEQRNRRRPVNVNALDSLGEEGEIEIDFSGFGNVAEEAAVPSKLPTSAQQSPQAATTTDGEGNAAPSSWALTKDAGKTCKERFNYASFDCAATILKTNPKAKSSTSILVENKDSYMLNECSAENKFIIVELCDDILIDTVVLANYEFFSSMFRHFRVSVSDRYPVKLDRWRVLGTFEARNSRDIQPFLVTEPQIWARYLRIEFLTHYGNEFYCPMSLLRVHGTTMMEQFREEQARGDDDFAESLDVTEGEPARTSLAGVKDTGVPAESMASEVEKGIPVTPDPQPHQDAEAPNSTVNHVASSSTSESSPSGSKETQSNRGTDTAAVTDPLGNVSSSSVTTPNDSTKQEEASSDPKQNSQPHRSNDHVSSANSSANSRADQAKSSSRQSSASTPPNPNAGASSSSSSSKPAPNTASNSSQSPSRAASQTQPNVAVPTTQESFFKSIHKRLQYLEANSTLSLQYIEEQSRILRDAFMKVEKKQLQKTEKFLDHLNNTVMHELKSYRNMYDQLWQSTILELEGMKERQRTEIGEIGARLSMVADELVWQKRMAVVQSTLLLLCLGLVLFVRSGPLGSQSDIPIVQQLGNTYSSFFDTPLQSPEEGRAPRRRRRTFRNIWRSETLTMSDPSISDVANIASSDVETDGQRSPVQTTFSPPTPVSTEGREVCYDQADSSPATGGETGLLTPTEDDSDTLEEQAKRLEVLETQSGPATPRGSRDSRPSWEEVDRAVDVLKAEERGEVEPPDTRTGRDSKKRQMMLRRVESYGGVGIDSPHAEAVEDEDDE